MKSLLTERESLVGFLDWIRQLGQPAAKRRVARRSRGTATSPTVESGGSSIDRTALCRCVPYSENEPANVKTRGSKGAASPFQTNKYYMKSLLTEREG